jgi:hypothetical protein
MRWRRKPAASAELDRLAQGRPNLRVFLSKSQVAAALWDYGEDELAARAIQMSEDELKAIEGISSWYEDPSCPLPMTGQRITHNHVSAFAAVTFFEGEVRELTRTRRRPAKDRPGVYEPLPPAPSRMD